MATCIFTKDEHVVYASNGICVIEDVKKMSFVKGEPDKLYYRSPLKNSREASGEGFFRRSKQKFARIVDPMRRIFVTNDGKSTADSSAVDFLEVTI